MNSDLRQSTDFPQILYIRVIVFENAWKELLRKGLIFFLPGLVIGLIYTYAFFINHRRITYIIPAGASLLMINGIPYIINLLRLKRKNQIIDPDVKSASATFLNNLLIKQPDLETGHLEAHVRGAHYPMGVGQKAFAIQLFPDGAIFIAKDLKDYFLIDKKSLPPLKINNKGGTKYISLKSSDRFKWEIIFAPIYMTAFENWLKTNDPKSMPDDFVCPSCNGELELNLEAKIDRQFNCPLCNNLISMKSHIGK